MLFYGERRKGYNLIKSFLKRVNLDGSIESFIISRNKTASKTDDNSIAVFGECKEELFENEFALTEISGLKRVLDKFETVSFEEDQDKILFKNRKSKLTWLKADKRIIQNIPKQTKEELSSLYSDDAIRIRLEKEDIDLLLKVLESGIDNKIKFITSENNLNVVVGQEHRYSYETVLKEGNITKNINNDYKVEHIVKVLKVVDSACDIILDCSLIGGESRSLPMTVKTSNDKFDFTYFIAPVVGG